MTPSAPWRPYGKQMPLESAVSALARTLSYDLPESDRARLKRMRPTQHPPLAFFRLASLACPPDWETRRHDWITLAAGMALMCPRPHLAGRWAGLTLAEAGLPESRMERLLTAEGETLRVMLLRTAYFLGAKQLSIDWAELALLLFVSDQKDKEAVRLTIARDYYRPLDHSQRKV